MVSASPFKAGLSQLLFFVGMSLGGANPWLTQHDEGFKHVTKNPVVNKSCTLVVC